MTFTINRTAGGALFVGSVPAPNLGFFKLKVVRCVFMFVKRLRASGRPKSGLLRQRER
jgi:hypothetical protein